MNKMLFLIEFYTNHPEGVKRGVILDHEHGWDINFAWVYADDKAAAKALLEANQGLRFDCVITCEQQAQIVPLYGNFRVNTPDANLFILGNAA